MKVCIDCGKVLVGKYYKEFNDDDGSWYEYCMECAWEFYGKDLGVYIGHFEEVNNG